MSEELYYRHYFLQIYEILREDEQNKKLSIKEKNVLADDDEILKGGMKAPVRTLYEELKADKISLLHKNLFQELKRIDRLHGMMLCMEIK